MRRTLDTGWTLSSLVTRDGAPSCGPVPAVVPGRVHGALAAAGVIGLVPSGDAAPIESSVASSVGSWVGSCDWRYALELDATAEQRHEHVDLVCDGLDTLATISLDGRLVGVTANMHRRHRFSLTDDLRPGPQRLTIDLASTSRHAEELRGRDAPWPSSSGASGPHVRSMAAALLAPPPDTPATSSGTPVSPVAPPAPPSTGIWRPVRLHAWSVARLGEVRVETSIEPPTGALTDERTAGPSARVATGRAEPLDADEPVERGRVVVDVPIVVSHALARALDVEVEFVVTDAAGTVVATERSTTTLLADRTVTASATIDVERVRRWWPHTLGTPTCYRLTVRLVADEVELDRWSGTVGFRTVDLELGSDPLGSAFTFVVNGVPLFVRGVLWTPAEPMPAPAARALVRRRLQHACAANVDLVRVWGGGVHESDDFAEACDELGILVWQDLPFAGSADPEPLLREEVQAETRDNVARLHHHPSLALWNGNDSCQQGHAEGAWADTLHERAWGEGFWSDDVPLVLEELDPSRPYWPGSPYSGPRLRPDADLHGTSHVWTGWGDEAAATVRGRACRFVAALGGRPPLTSLPRDAEPAADQLARAVEQLHRSSTPPSDAGASVASVASGIVQARAARTAIEYFRSLRDHCMGTVWWQLADDATPSAGSGALLDRDGRPTPVWYAVRDAYADRLATVQPRGHELVLHLVNDSSRWWRVAGCAERIRLDGTLRYGRPIHAVVAPRSVARITLDACLASPRDPAGEALVIDVGGTSAWWWFTDELPPAKRPDAPAPGCVRVAEVARSGDRLVVDVTSTTVVRDLVSSLDRLGAHATVDRQLVTLRPGRAERLTFTGVDGDVGLGTGDALLARVSASFSWTG